VRCPGYTHNILFQLFLLEILVIPLVHSLDVIRLGNMSWDMS